MLSYRHNKNKSKHCLIKQKKYTVCETAKLESKTLKLFSQKSRIFNQFDWIIIIAKEQQFLQLSLFTIQHNVIIAESGVFPERRLLCNVSDCKINEPKSRVFFYSTHSTSTGLCFDCVGFWSKDESVVDENKVYGFLRKNLTYLLKKPIRVAAYGDLPALKVTPEPHGYVIDVLKLLQSTLHFEISSTTKPIKYGKKENDGEWSGMFGQLQNDEIDVAVGDITINIERMEVCDFTIPIYRDRVKFFYRTEQLYRFRVDRSMLMFYPFQIEV
ncbi:glutamate receptor ionotropic: kainate 2-like protein [Leptotrombidium deliense]|uniref:Glutamate receptor ionotropic: kainate 2-like protein n=1 Tax=Leptotrombidium deliense TaxID=299467 RepID=A0A443RYP9_9ACAR|nr:glutamate receptor ionotropic: kainate 2-like protein [Leptotrombidium deliense]